jgi:hypothetical protein
MKNKLIIFCSALLVFIGLSAFNAQAQNNGEFKFETETHDFGKIPQGTPVTYEFKFENTGTEPLIISNVESTCGCTVPEYTKTPIKPGEKGAVSVTFNAAQAAPFSKMVTIRSNAKTPVKALYIKGTVVK